MSTPILSRIPAGAPATPYRPSLVSVRNVLDYASYQEESDAIPSRGGVLYFPSADGAYVISSTILVKSGTRVVMEEGASIVPTATQADFTPISNAVIGGTAYPLFANVNYAAADITDEDISYEGLLIGPTSGRWNGQLLFHRRVRNLQVARCRGRHCNSFAATLASIDSMFERCEVEHAEVAAFDHWEGPRNATIKDCTVYNQDNGGDGHAVLFNAGHTVEGYAGKPWHGRTLTVDNLKAYCLNNPAVYAGPLAAAEDGNTLEDVKILNSYFSKQGVNIQNVRGFTVDHCTFEELTGSAVFAAEENAPEYPSSYGTVTYNVIKNTTLPGEPYFALYGPGMVSEHNSSFDSTAYAGVILDNSTSRELHNNLSGVTYKTLLQTQPGVPVTPWAADNSGTYTPTLTIVTNLDTVTAFPCQYLRVGNVVTVSGKISVDATLASTITELRMTLPVASAFTETHELAGTITAGGAVPSYAGVVYADTANDMAFIRYNGGETGVRSMFFTFTYQVL